ncbi:MAG: hypothetical protein KJ908_07755 [Acidobacteria bacterium]|nr:hypothetical protein [Acidobacteriota bacterium]
MDKQINIIGIFWIVYGALGIFAGFLLFFLLFGLSFIPDVGYPGTVILRGVGIGAGIFFTFLSLPEVLAGYGVLKGKEWGRILCLVMSFLNLINIPLGTALGIYSFIILTKEESIAHFHTQKT